MQTRLTPELVLYGYQHGVFPMADPDDDNAVYWYRPEQRGILPLDAFYVPQNLARLVRQEHFDVASNRDFPAVIRACANRRTTWISEEIIDTYTALHRWGYAHSVECRQDGVLVGGLYGVALGGAFFGESMFHRVDNASKVALVHLVRRLRSGGFVLLDTQYVTDHLKQFGVVEIPDAEYEHRLAEALGVEARWVSGAVERMPELKLCDGTIVSYTVTLVRPRSYPDLEKDLAVEKQLRRRLRSSGSSGFRQIGTGWHRPGRTLRWRARCATQRAQLRSLGWHGVLRALGEGDDPSGPSGFPRRK